MTLVIMGTGMCVMGVSVMVGLDALGGRYDFRHGAMWRDGGRSGRVGRRHIRGTE